MRIVVAAFVVYAPNFELPWAVGTDHGKALFELEADHERYAERKAHGFSRGMMKMVAN